MHPNDLTSYVSAMREREDEALLRRLPGSEKRDLRLKDAPIRLRCDVDAVCNRAVDDADPAITKIRAALAKRLDPAEVDILLLPLGVGHHVDHSTVREAVLPLAQSLACGFYEDLPYGLRVGADQEIDNLVKQMRMRWGMQLTPMICREDERGCELKRKLVGIYSSQIDGDAADALARSVERYGGERVWASDQLTAMVQAGIAGWSGWSSDEAKE